MKRMLIMTFLIFLVSTGISQDNKKNSISPTGDGFRPRARLRHRPPHDAEGAQEAGHRAVEAVNI